MAHAFSPSPWRQRQVDLSELEASLVCIVSSRTARTVTQRNPVSKQPNKAKFLEPELTWEAQT